MSNRWEHKAMDVVHEWRDFWVDQDDGIYRDRATAIDANMRYNLADLIEKALIEERKSTIEECANLFRSKTPQERIRFLLEDEIE